MRMSFFAMVQVVIIVADIRDQLAVSEFQNSGCGTVDKRGEIDALPELVAFAKRLEEATLSTIEAGEMTKDLALITSLPEKKILNSGAFLDAIARRL